MVGDVGLDQIDVFYRGAAAGKFHMEPGVAEGCAADVQTLIDALEAQRDSARTDMVGAFGGFASAAQMHDGFATKLKELTRFLSEYIEAAQKLKLSFAIAGGAVEAQENENVASLTAADAVGALNEGPGS